MKKLLRIIIVLAVLAGGAYFVFIQTTTPSSEENVDETETSLMPECITLKKTLDALPQSINLFGHTLALSNIDCTGAMTGDPYEEGQNMRQAQRYE